MAAKTVPADHGDTNPVKPRPSAADTQIRDLRNAVGWMDCLAQGGFSEISAIAKLALARLETPEGYRHLDVIASALMVIWSKAEDTQKAITDHAEEFGCAYVDEAEQLRSAAEAAHREELCRNAEAVRSHGAQGKAVAA